MSEEVLVRQKLNRNDWDFDYKTEAFVMKGREFSSQCCYAGRISSRFEIMRKRKLDVHKGQERPIWKDKEMARRFHCRVSEIY